jgi:hypothetical protein
MKRCLSVAGAILLAALDGKVLTVGQQLNTPQGSFNTKIALNRK